jgi:hypothetical protein
MLSITRAHGVRACQQLKWGYKPLYSTCCHKKTEKEEKKATSLKFWSDPVTWQRTRVNTLR